jgi:hypothetical protein
MNVESIGQFQEGLRVLLDLLEAIDLTKENRKELTEQILRMMQI